MAFGVQGEGFRNPSEIIANIVIVEGPKAGLFVYNGTPQAGNPPILSISNNTVDPYGNTITPSLSLSGLPELIYSGPPALGNLIAAIAGAAGTDEFGNTYVAGAQFGAMGQSQVQVIPDQGSAFNVTTAISGVLQAVAALTTTDINEVLAGFLGSVLLGTGTTAKMSTVLTSPIGSGSGAALVLQAENDGDTDTAVITFGTITTPDDSTEIFTPIMTITPYALLVYGGTSGTTVVTKSSGSGTIPIPAGVTTAKAECWGGGGGGHCGIVFGTTANGGEYGGAGGEYAQEPNLAVTGGGTVAYSVGAGSAGTAPGGGTPGNAGNSTLTGSAVTVTAHGATVTGNLPIGGTGSANTTHHNGGNGGTNPHVNTFPAGFYNGGAGAGSSAGPSAAGNNGANTSSNTGASGATAPSGGGNGGKGGSNGSNGSNGSAPGGGGGGGWANSNSATSGGNGDSGQVRLTYQNGTPPIIYSLATAAGTDQFGTAYPAGMQYTAPDTNVYNPGGRLTKNITSAPQTINSTGAINVNNLSFPVVANTTYEFEALLFCTQGAVNAQQAVGISGPATSFCSAMTEGWDSTAGSGVVALGAAQLSAMGTRASIATGPGTITNTHTFIVRIRGKFTTSAAGGGTFTITASCITAATDTFTINAGSYCTLIASA